MRMIQAAIEGRNTVIIHPTGSGKSICFQIPHLITGKATIIITPTISLMQDQTTKLQEKGIRASFLGSTQTDPSTMNQYVEGKIELLFITVERLFTGGEANSSLVKMGKEGKIGLIAIDEAHLISVWKSFRYIIVVFCIHMHTTILIFQARLHTPWSISFTVSRSTSYGSYSNSTSLCTRRDTTSCS